MNIEPHEVLMAASLSNEAYGKKGYWTNGALKLTSSYGNDVAYVIDHKTLHRRSLWVAIRGSDDPLDWLMNLDIRTDDSGFWLQGFYEPGEQIALQLIGLINREFAGLNRLVITGHSRGGALADVLGQIIASSSASPDRLDVITFGAPRTTQVYAPPPARDCNIVRVVNGGDPVPHLPPARLGWRHNGERLDVGYAPDFFEQLRLYAVARALRIGGPWRNLPSLEPHDPEEYIRSVRLWKNDIETGFAE